MWRKALLACVVVIGGALMGARAEAPPAASRVIPQEAILAVELRRPGELLDQLYRSGLIEQAAQMPVVRQALDSPDLRQFRGLVRYLETTLGVDWKTGLRKLVGNGVAVAFGGGGEALLVVDATDEQLLEQFHRAMLGLVRADAVNHGRPDPVSEKKYEGVTVWSVGNQTAHAIVGQRLLLSNRGEVLTAALDLQAGRSQASLAESPLYREAQAAVGPDAVAFAFVNMKAVKQDRGVQRALEQTREPLVALLVGGLLEALSGADWLAAEFELDGPCLAVEATCDAAAEVMTQRAAFAWPSASDQGALPNLQVPRRIAALSFYRDLHAFYAAKDELFPQRTSGLIFFENMMGIFFSGRDLTDEVLAQATPDIRIVVAEQEYDPQAGTPQVKLPAFAAVFRMRHPDQFREVAEEAWQKALGLINFSRGQQGLPGMIMDRVTHGDTKFSMSYFSTAGLDKKTDLDIQFNFRPSLAMPGQYLILSSTDGLARDLIDAVNKEKSQGAKPLPMVNTVAELDGVRLASILRANQENLIQQNMVEEGNTREQAEGEIGILLSLIERLKGARLEFGQREGRPRLRLEVTVNLPSSP